MLKLRVSMLRCVRWYTTSATVALFIALSASGQSAAPLGIAVTNDVVTVSEIAPGAEVVLFGCVRTTRGGRALVERYALSLRDDDGDGIAVHRSGGAPSRLSTWVAVEMSTGRVAVGAPAPRIQRVDELSAKVLKRSSEGLISTMEREMRRALVLLVRPGQGAWTCSARDGADGDEDKVRNARVSLSFESARALDGKRNAPKYLKPGDVVVVIDPVLLDVYVATVAN